MFQSTFNYIAEKAHFVAHTTLPRMLSLSLVEGCNLACSMCGQWRRAVILGSRPGERFLPLQKVKDLADEVASHGTEIYVWGGEPTLHSDFGEIISYVKDKGIVCAVNTNGLLLRDFVEVILRSKIDSLYVSLDGPANIHDSIRGRKGTYAKVMDGLAKLHKNGAGKRPLVVAQITLSKSNLRHVEQLLWELEKNDAVDMSIVQLGWFVTTEVGTNYERRIKEDFGSEGSSWIGFRDDMASERAREIRELVYRIKCAEFRKPILFFPSLRQGMIERYYVDHSDSFGRKRCGSIYRRLEIRPNGDAVVCFDFPDIVVGNVYEQTIAEIWTGNQLRKFRRNLRNKGLLPICTRCCGLFRG